MDRECIQCKRIFITVWNAQHKCHECTAINEDTNDVVHSFYIRCPHCKDIRTVKPKEFTEDCGYHVSCTCCKRGYDIGVSVSYTYISPKLIKSSK